ncbi:MAG: hypothetical protein QW772_05270 [Zestosphaera sp.]
MPLLYVFCFQWKVRKFIVYMHQPAVGHELPNHLEEVFHLFRMGGVGG